MSLEGEVRQRGWYGMGKPRALARLVKEREKPRNRCITKKKVLSSMDHDNGGF